jgi:hypothetical protein
MAIAWNAMRKWPQLPCQKQTRPRRRDVVDGHLRAMAAEFPVTPERRYYPGKCTGMTGDLYRNDMGNIEWKSAFPQCRQGLNDQRVYRNAGAAPVAAFRVSCGT